MITDIAYAEPVGRAHLLDLHLPADAEGARPLVIWTGGSAWLADNGKDSAGSIAAVFNPRGYAVAGVSVRASTQATFPAQLDDIRAAIRWLRDNAGQYGIDPERIAIMGDSSGGWTTVMAALNDDGIGAAVAYEALKAQGATATFYSVPAAGHDRDAVLDPANQDGTTVRRTAHGHETVDHTPPTWDAIEGFIRAAV